MQNIKMGISLANKSIDKNVCHDIINSSSKMAAIVDNIGVFLKELNRTYSNIANQFPLFEGKVREESERVLSVSNYFTGGIDKDIENSFSNVLEYNASELNKSFERVNTFIEDDNKLSESIIEDASKTNKIMESIGQIRQLAEEIKVYSLNAIIISSKHGVVGKAFGEISKNIIRLSDISNEQADTMNKMGNELLTRFDSFKNKIIETNNTQQAFFFGLKNTISEEQETILKSFSLMSTILNNIISRLENAYDVFDIMMVLQEEDIVRQQIEHIASSLKILIEENKEFVSDYNKYSDGIRGSKILENEDIKNILLDIITFNDVVLGISVYNFKDVYSSINDANSKIKNKLLAIRQTLTTIVQDRNILIEYMTGYKASGRTFPFILTDKLFEKYVNLIKDYLSRFKKFIDAKTVISEDNISVNDAMENLQDMFEETKNIAKTFNAINFLAKIELEKNAEIFKDSKAFSIESVEAIAVNITNTVEQCLSQFNSIKAKIDNSILNFNGNISRQSGEYSAIELMVYDIGKRLYNAKSIIKENIKLFEDYGDTLFALIDSTISDIESFKKLLLSIDDMTNVCADMQEDIKKKKDYFFEYYGIDSWKIQSSKYIDMMKMYTMERERLIASEVLNEVADISLDIDVSGGEHNNDFTLF